MSRLPPPPPAPPLLSHRRASSQSRFTFSLPPSDDNAIARNPLARSPSTPRAHLPAQPSVNVSPNLHLEQYNLADIIALIGCYHGHTATNDERTTECLNRWLFAVNLFQIKHRLADADILRLGVLLLRDTALDWLHSLELQSPGFTWPAFQRGLHLRFARTREPAWEECRNPRTETRSAYVRRIVQLFRSRGMNCDLLVAQIVKGMNDRDFYDQLRGHPIRSLRELYDRMEQFERLQQYNRRCIR